MSDVRLPLKSAYIPLGVLAYLVWWKWWCTCLKWCFLKRQNLQTFFQLPGPFLRSVLIWREFFLRKWGCGYWGKLTPKSIWIHHLRPSNPNMFWGRTPRLPTERHTLQSSLNNLQPFPTELGITHLSDFFGKTHSEAVWTDFQGEIYCTPPFLPDSCYLSVATCQMIVRRMSDACQIHYISTRDAMVYVW